MEVAIRSHVFLAVAVATLLSFPAEAAHDRRPSHLYPGIGVAPAMPHRENLAGQMPSGNAYDGPIFDGYGNRVGTYRGNPWICWNKLQSVDAQMDGIAPANVEIGRAALLALSR